MIETTEQGSLTIIPFLSGSLPHVEQADIDASTSRYKRLANLRLRNSDTIVLSGHGCFLKVRDGSLMVEYPRPSGPGTSKLLRLSKGVHKIKQIVVTAESGYLTIDAIKWACQQDITIYLISFNGELLQVLTPRQTRNARLCYLQYKASESGLAVQIARELVRMKTEAQIALLKALPSHPTSDENMVIVKGQKVMLTEKVGEVGYGEYIWQFFDEALAKLPHMKQVNAIQLLEGRLAITYWNLLVGLPLHWKSSDRKKIPPHWLRITERTSEVSAYRNAHRAVNPYHAVLNFCYALLQADVLRAIHIAGLEPSVGFLHTSLEEGKSALAWDLMEAFRPKVDGLVLSFFQKNTFHKGDFTEEESGEVRMYDELKRLVVASCRVDNIQIDRVARWLRSMLENS